MKKQGSFKVMFLVMLVSLVIASLWDKLPAIKNSIHYVLNPTAGALMNWNLTIGMLIVVLIISALTTVIQKYTTDQTELKRLKKEQKALQKEMKEHKSNPQKMAELQKKQMAFIPQQFKLQMGSIAYTAVPLILLFRWFGDYFGEIMTTTGEPVRFFGFLGWFLFYLIVTMVFSSLLKKWWDIA
ncbi:MAG: DUF106 domain-containing protein [Nanoarchaeota archaeon]|nr:DUF106 domain-containing protein [Nanoarchaeota archaeon]